MRSLHARRGAGRGAAALHAALLLGFAACASAPGGDAYTERAGWRTRIAHAGEAKLNGVAAGDVDPGTPGDEIVACANDGSVVLVRRRGGGFASEVIARTDGELLQIAVGEVDGASPGAEVVAVGVVSGAEDGGAPGVAWLLSRDGDGWRRRELFAAGALLHAVVVADVDPEQPGNEVALAGFTRDVHLVRWNGGAPAAARVAELPGNAKGAAALPGGLAVACDDGTLVVLGRANGGALVETARWRGEAPLARVAARGTEILFCANDGALRLLAARGEAEPTATPCFEAGDRLRGAVFLDSAGTSPADRSGGDAAPFEVATAGYDGGIDVIRLAPARAGSEGAPTRAEGDVASPVAGEERYAITATRVAADTDKLHHLARGRIAGLGEVLISAGYSGRVLVVGRAAAER